MAKEISGMSAGFLVGADEGAQVLLGGLSVQFKLRAGQTGGQLSVTETTLDPHRLVPPHVHADEDEYAYVARGHEWRPRRRRGVRGTSGKLSDQASRRGPRVLESHRGAGQNS